VNVFDIHTYYPSPNADFAHKPLLQWLPHISREQIKELVSAPVAFALEERTHSADLRVQYLNRLLRFFSPTEEQVDFAQGLLNLILQAYAAVPADPNGARRRFNDMCEALARGNYRAKDNPELVRSLLCVSLIGTPGCGKSRVVELLLGRLGTAGSLYRHPQHPGLYHLLSLTVQVPKVRHQKSLAYLVYQELYEAFLATGAHRPRLAYAANSGAVFAREAATLASLLHLGILVIDEVQHMVHLTKGLDTESMEFLTTLVNSVAMPALLIGTWKAVALLSSETRLARRTLSPASTNFYRFSPGQEWKDLVFQVLVYQWVHKPLDYSDEAADVLHGLTQGIPDILVKLTLLAQLHAIRDRSETVTLDLIKAVAALHLKHLAPSLDYMRTGVNETAHELWDAEPADFGEYLLKLDAVCAARATRKDQSRLNEDIRALQVARALTATQAASPEASAVIAKAAVNDNPDASALELTKMVLQNMTRRGPKPTKSASALAKVDKEFEALKPEDIRRVVYFANRAKSDVQEELFKAGHLKPVHEVIAP